MVLHAWFKKYTIIIIIIIIIQYLCHYRYSQRNLLKIRKKEVEGDGKNIWKKKLAGIELHASGERGLIVY